MNSSQTPLPPIDRIAWPWPSQPLKSPVTRTARASGAHTVKATPRDPSIVRTCAPRTRHSSS